MPRAALLAAVAALATLTAGAAVEAAPFASVHFPDNRPATATDELTEDNVNVAEFQALEKAFREDSHLYAYCTGHTSSAGEASDNSALSHRRCGFLMHHLKEAGVVRLVPPNKLNRQPPYKEYQVPDGCTVDGAIVSCGESQATGDAAADRRADFDAVERETTCSAFWLGKQTCGNYSPNSFVAKDTKCLGVKDCREKCCHGTCGQFWGSGDLCAFGKKPLDDNMSLRLQQCGSPSKCADTCCASTNNVKLPKGMITNPNFKPKQTFIGPGRPKRGCEKWHSCTTLCLQHSPSRYNVGGGASVQQQKCGMACNQLFVFGCAGDRHIGSVNAGNCKQICTQR